MFSKWRKWTEIRNGWSNIWRFSIVSSAASVRRELEAEIKPDPQRAQALRLAYMQPQKGLLRRLWPDLHVILSVDSGAFDVYRRLVLENEAFGLRTYSPVYAATEGILGSYFDSVFVEVIFPIQLYNLSNSNEVKENNNLRQHNIICMYDR